MIHPARCPVCDGAARVWRMLQADDVICEVVCAACFLWAVRQMLAIFRNVTAKTFKRRPA